MAHSERSLSRAVLRLCGHWGGARVLWPRVTVCTVCLHPTSLWPLWLLLTLSTRPPPECPPDAQQVLKLDIDTTPVELSIVHAIATDHSLSALVDELLFEYHFDFDKGVKFGWPRHTGHTVDDALRLMRRLRSVGVRAHFWT